MKVCLSDAHLHFCDHTRLPELRRFFKRLAVERAALVSLPVPGRINFNPELIFAKARLPGQTWILPGFDYTARFFPRRGESFDLGGQVEQLHRLGCDGIKIFAGKPGFQRRLALKLDGPAFAGAFRAAASLKLPVLVHVADPPWLFAAGERPTFEELQRQALRVLKAHPDCVFVFPHLLMLAGDLKRLTVLLAAHGNLFLDLAPGRYFYAELSRRREEARDFFRRFADRILFGSDGFWFPPGFDMFPPADLAENLGRARMLLDFLAGEETFPNPFPPTQESSPRVRGLELEQPVLDRILGLNFARVFGGRPRPLDRPAGLAYLTGFRVRLARTGGGPDAAGAGAAVEAAVTALGAEA
jgi:hypothetical protein